MDAVRILDKSYWNVIGSATFKAAAYVPTSDGVRAINRAQLVITNGNHSTVDGPRFLGERRTDGYDRNNLTSQPGATAGAVNGVTVQNNTMARATRVTGWEFVSINAQTTTPRPTTNVSIVGNTVTTRQYGISANWVTGLTVQQNLGTTTTGGGPAEDGGSKYGLVALGGGLKTVNVTSNSFLPRWEARSTPWRGCRRPVHRPSPPVSFRAVTRCADRRMN